MPQRKPASSRASTLEEAVLVKNALARSADQTSFLSVSPSERGEQPRSWQHSWGGLDAGYSPGYQNQSIRRGEPQHRNHRYDDVSRREHDEVSEVDEVALPPEGRFEANDSDDLENEAADISILRDKQRQSLTELRQSGAGGSSIWKIPELKPERVRSGPKQVRLAFGRPQSVMESRPISWDPRMVTLSKPRPVPHASTLQSFGLPVLAENSGTRSNGRDRALQNTRPYTSLGCRENTRIDQLSIGPTLLFDRRRSTVDLPASGNGAVAEHATALKEASVEFRRLPSTTRDSSLARPPGNPSKPQPLRAQTAGPCFQCASSLAERDWLSSAGSAFEQPSPWGHITSNRPFSQQSRGPNPDADISVRVSRTAVGHRDGVRNGYNQRRVQSSMVQFRTGGAPRQGDVISGDVTADVILDGRVPKTAAVSGLYRSCLALEGRLRSLELLSLEGGRSESTLGGARRNMAVSGSGPARPHTAFPEGSRESNAQSAEAAKRPATSFEGIRGNGLVGRESRLNDSDNAAGGVVSLSRTLEFSLSPSCNVPEEVSRQCPLQAGSFKQTSPSAARALTKAHSEVISPTRVRQTDQQEVGIQTRVKRTVQPEVVTQAQVRQTVQKLQQLAAEMGGILQGDSEEARWLAALTITRHVRGFLCRRRYAAGVKALRDWRREEFAPIRGLLTSWLRKRAAQEVRMKVLRAVRERRQTGAILHGWREQVLVGRQERAQGLERATRLRADLLRRRGAAALRKWLRVANGPQSRVQLEERYQHRWEEARGRLQAVADQKGWSGTLTEDMVHGEVHAAAVEEMRERACARVLERAFREWKKLAYVRRALARYQRRLQSRVLQEMFAALWDKRARVGEAMWARRKIHRAARRLGRRKLLKESWDTWQEEVDRGRKVRAFWAQKERVHGLRALPVGFRRDPSATATWMEIVANCAARVAIEAAAVSRAFRRWQALWQMQATLRALRDARIRADQRTKGVGLLRLVLTAWGEMVLPNRSGGVDVSAVRKDSKSVAVPAGGHDTHALEPPPAEQEPNPPLDSLTLTTEALKAALLERRYEPPEDSRAPADAELRRLRSILARLETECKSQHIESSESPRYLKSILEPGDALYS